MKVLLVGNYPADGQESMLRFAQALCEGLRDTVQVQLWQPKVRVNFWNNKWLGYIDKFLIGSVELWLASRKFDLVHICDHSNAPYLFVIGNKKHLVTCNDCIAIKSARGEFAEQRVSWSGRWLQKLILSGLRKAEHITCISQATRSDVLQLVSLKPERVTVTYMGLTYPYQPQQENDEKLESLSQKQFILHVGNNNWYKNREGVLRIYAKVFATLGAQAPLLVLVGKKPTRAMIDFTQQQGIQKNVCILENVSNERLEALYSQARLLLFPSLYEGFGWPIAEALACGCPVLTTRQAPMTEVGGDVAEYAERSNDEQFAEKVCSMLAVQAEDTTAQRALRIQQAQNFSQERMMESYWKLYTEIA